MDWISYLKVSRKLQHSSINNHNVSFHATVIKLNFTDLIIILIVKNSHHPSPHKLYCFMRFFLLVFMKQFNNFTFKEWAMMQNHFINDYYHIVSPVNR